MSVSYLVGNEREVDGSSRCQYRPEERLSVGFDLLLQSSFDAFTGDFERRTIALHCVCYYNIL